MDLFWLKLRITLATTITSHHITFLTKKRQTFFSVHTNWWQFSSQIKRELNKSHSTNIGEVQQHYFRQIKKIMNRLFRNWQRNIVSIGSGIWKFSSSWMKFSNTYSSSDSTKLTKKFNFVQQSEKLSRFAHLHEILQHLFISESSKLAKKFNIGNSVGWEIFALRAVEWNSATFFHLWVVKISKEIEYW